LKFLDEYEHLDINSFVISKKFARGVCSGLTVQDTSSLSSCLLLFDQKDDNDDDTDK